MSRIAFLLLCHKDAERVIHQAKVLTSRGDAIAIHIDASAPEAMYREVHAALKDEPSVVFARRLRCGWGEWSLVAATLELVKAAETAFADATHFFLLSGDCMPIKPAHYIHSMLDSESSDRIEHADFFDDDWIKTGMKEDRLIYRHFFNERTQKRLFYGSLAVQRKLGLTRAIPKGLRMKIGSQWWVLRRSTIEKILAFTRSRPDVMRFFRTTWIPDETFFQTLVMHLVPREEVIGQPPTFLMFSDYGMPITFYSDHYELLRHQRQLFARKISDNDEGLRKSLGALFQSEEALPATEDTGRTLYDYIRRRGRIGRRFAPRIWEEGARLGPEYTLNLVICKKWHIGNRIASALGDAARFPAFGYVFDDEAPALPDLGGIEKTLAKRGRHRRAVLRMMAEVAGSKRLAICLDPGNIAAVEDFRADGCALRVLEVETETSDTWLAGHAGRLGLGAAAAEGGMQAGLLETLRRNIEDERMALRELGLPYHVRIREGELPGALARPIAQAFEISVDAGAAIARTPNLFD